MGIVVDDRRVDEVEMDGRRQIVPNQILIRPVGVPRSVISFSRLGDSGALVCDEEDRVVGLLWGASTGGDGLACHIEPALETLGIAP